VKRSHVSQLATTYQELSLLFDVAQNNQSVQNGNWKKYCTLDVAWFSDKLIICLQTVNGNIVHPIVLTSK
jgi:hypothetical protein